MLFRTRFRINPPNLRFYATDTTRVRFAPSPTGFLHLGGLRTALYNFLFAKAHNGKFILRIEDTDQSRLVEGAMEQLQGDLAWAGIEVDEGPAQGGAFGPYIQSQRLGLYRHHVQTLLNNTSAYHCFCTDKRLELLRKEALRAREVPKYDNRCRSLGPEETHRRLVRGEPSCIRFKLTPGPETFNDVVYGSITYDVAANEGDPVIIKSDGFPTYHFASVVDDHCMKISHVLRGVEWQISTTKHVLMYRAFNWEPPSFGHLPLLVNPDGTKLSKRQGDIKISHYRDSGIFPLALINFIVNSGGGFEKDSEKNLKPKSYSMNELTEQFHISRVNSHPSKVMLERLSDFNRLELKRKLQSPREENSLVEEVRTLVEGSLGLTHESLETSPQHVRHILSWASKRIHKLSDLVSNDLKFIWVCPKNHKIDDKNSVNVRLFIENLETCPDLSRETLNPFLKRFCEDHGIKFGDFMKVLRSILSGLKEGPSVAEMMEILGREATMKRLASCLNTR